MAREAADLLVDVLDQSWLAGSDKAEQSHPILAAWQRCDLGSFLTLNSLAADLRQLTAVEGLTSVLHDLKQERGYHGALLTLHSAAMFQRGGSQVVKFFEPSVDSVPDYLISVNEMTRPVEVKQLTESEQSKRFTTYAESLTAAIKAHIFDDFSNFPAITIVLKDADQLPDSNDILGIIKDLFKIGRNLHLDARSRLFNIFTNPDAPKGWTRFRRVNFICPRSPKENTRLLRNVEQANKQLKYWNNGKSPGLLCLGITKYQEPQDVFDFISSKFNGDQYRSISDAVILEAGHHIGPPLLSTLDLWCGLRHPYAHFPAPLNTGFRAEGSWGNLLQVRPKEASISTYQTSFVEADIARDGARDQRLILPDYSKLSPEMLAD